MVIENVKKEDYEQHHIYSQIVLKDYEGKVVNKLFFKRNFEVYFENMLNILYLIFIAFFINFISPTSC